MTTGEHSLFQGACVMTDSLLSVKMKLMKAPRVTDATVRGSHSSVVPSAMLIAMSPRCGGPSQCTVSPLKSYFAILESAQAEPKNYSAMTSGISWAQQRLSPLHIIQVSSEGSSGLITEPVLP